MTAPIARRNSVAAESSVYSSGRARFDGRRIKRAFDTSSRNHAAASGRAVLASLGKLVDELAEALAAFLEVAELVIACARRREQDDLSLVRVGAGPLQRDLQRPAVDQRNCARQILVQPPRCLADQIGGAAVRDQVV